MHTYCCMLNQQFPLMLVGSIIIVCFVFFVFFAEYVQTGPYNKAYTESQLQAGGGFILPDFNEEQVSAVKTSWSKIRKVWING